MSMRIKIDDIALLPMQAVVNAGMPSDYVRLLSETLKRVGFGYNDVQCSFSENRDGNDLPWLGVRCQLLDEIVDIPEEIFLQHLKNGAACHLTQYPQDTQIVSELFQRYEESFKHPASPSSNDQT